MPHKTDWLDSEQQEAMVKHCAETWGVDRAEAQRILKRAADSGEIKIWVPPQPKTRR